MFDIYMRCYPSWDRNITEEWDAPQFSSLNEANKFIAELEENYSDEGWRGYYLYKAKFYACES